MEGTSHLKHNIHNALLVIRPSNHPSTYPQTINQSIIQLIIKSITQSDRIQERQTLKLLVYKYVCQPLHELQNTDRTIV